MCSNSSSSIYPIIPLRNVILGASLSFVSINPSSGIEGCSYFGTISFIKLKLLFFEKTEQNEKKEESYFIVHYIINEQNEIIFMEYDSVEANEKKI